MGENSEQDDVIFDAPIVWVSIILAVVFCLGAVVGKFLL